MFINNLETKVEHFDMTDEVKVSTVMNETEVQNISASNINDNNVEGDCPPPKGENTSLIDEEMTTADNNAASSFSSSLTINDIIKNRNISPEALIEIIDAAKNDNLFPSDTLRGQKLHDKIHTIRKWVDDKVEELNNAPLSITMYKKKKAILQARASYVLILECFIGEELQRLRKMNGTNDKSEGRKSGEERTKTQIIQEDYGLSPRLSRDFQHLSFEGVKNAIELALRRNDIPTRALALSESAKLKSGQNPSNHHNKYTKFELDYIEETEIKTLLLKDPIYITTLFSNISLGLARVHELNLFCRVAAEWDKTRALWHELLYPDCHMVQGDFTDPDKFNDTLEWHKKQGCEIVMASCCCEPFSNLNNSSNKGNVPEAKQFYYTAEFILKAKPKYFIIENVPGFVNARPKIAHDVLKDKDGNIRCIGQYLRDTLGEEYHLNFGIYTAADYSCVEDRSRLIILGCRKDVSSEPWKFPKKHAVRKMLWEVIGDLSSLDNGAVDPNDSWHYARELPECVINFLKHTPTGCSAWDNDADYQPLRDNGEYSNGNYNKGFTRTNWQNQCPTITTGNGRISDLCSLHPGRYNPSTQEYTDCRVFSLRELLRIMDCPDDFFDKLHLKREENGMLNETEENNLRKAIGQHFCCLHVNALFSTLPIPINDNQLSEANVA